MEPYCNTAMHTDGQATYQRVSWDVIPQHNSCSTAIPTDLPLLWAKREKDTLPSLKNNNIVNFSSGKDDTKY